MGNILIMRKLNLLYDKFYYTTGTEYTKRPGRRTLYYSKVGRIPVWKLRSGDEKLRFPCPNGYNSELQQDFMSMMKYYEEEKKTQHLFNSRFAPDCYEKVDSLKEKKNIPIPQVKIHFPFLTEDITANFDLQYHDASVDDLNEDLYFYVIEPINFEFLQAKKYTDKISGKVIDGIEEDIIDNISPKVIEMINEGRCKLLIDHGHEGSWQFDRFYKWYKNLLLKNKIDINEIYIFLCDLNYKAKFKSGVDIKIKFIPSIFYIEALSREVVKIKNRGGEQTVLGYQYTCPDIKDIDIKSKDKYFLCLLRNCGKTHRKALATYFEYHDLWNNNIISFLKGNWSSDVPGIIPKKYKSMMSKLDKKDMVELDTQNTENKWGFSPMHTNREDFHKETFLTIVVETLFEDIGIFLTEKVLKPLWNLHPFIVVSAPYTLKRLHELGFKTFHPFIDESYDEIENHSERMNKILLELDKFREKSIDELQAWWVEILPILKYNQDVFFGYTKKKTGKVTFFEEFGS